MGYITIDTGTTNTRIRYIEDNEILGCYKAKVGVRDTAITGSLKKLKTCIRKGIEICLKTCSREITDVEKIIASGMITSNLGLEEIPHLEAPVGIEDLSRNIVVKSFDSIINKPIYFIPGVKNRVETSTKDSFDEIDMMRGEEVECFGALHLSGIAENVLFISPGSHTKFVFVNSDQEIEKCSTTLTGELLWAIAKETILANSIPETLISNIDIEFIRKGIATVQKYGFTRTCFSVRIMDIFADATSNQRANFLAGAICYYDIKSINDDLLDKNPQILIGGSQILRDLYKSVLEIMDYDISKIKRLNDELVEKSSTIGAIKIIENCT